MKDHWQHQLLTKLRSQSRIIQVPKIPNLSMLEHDWPWFGDNCSLTPTSYQIRFLGMHSRASVPDPYQGGSGSRLGCRASAQMNESMRRFYYIKFSRRKMFQKLYVINKGSEVQSWRPLRVKVRSPRREGIEIRSRHHRINLGNILLVRQTVHVAKGLHPTILTTCMNEHGDVRRLTLLNMF